MCRQRAEHVPISCRKGTENLHYDKRFCKKVYKMILYQFAEVSKMCPKKSAEFRCCKTAARLAGWPPANPAALAGWRPPSPARAERRGGTRGHTRRGTPSTGGGAHRPKGGGGHRPRARGAADAGGRGARHGARAWQRARGAGGPTPRMATKTPLYIHLYRFSSRRQWKMHCRIT